MTALRLPFEIVLAWSDLVLTVAPCETALDVLIRAGVPVEPGCRVGSCGECAIPYVEGPVDHRDACLSAGDRQRLWCPCVSRGSGAIVLPF